MIKIHNIERTNISYYAIEKLSAGDVVGLDKTNPNQVTRVHKSKTRIPVGISRQYVIDPDTEPYRFINLPMVGAKIEILTRGTIICRLDKSLKIPINQPIYVDLQTSKLTWKNVGPLVGKSVSSQNKDGYFKVEVNF